MYYEDDSGATGFLAGVLVGAAIGAGIALLTAPHSGRTMRARLVRRDAGGATHASGDDMDRDSIMYALKQRRRRRTK